MAPKQRLELNWIGKDQQNKLEPRILIEDSDRSYGDLTTENKLIFGDNLLALKALEQDFAGKIKCVFIDPPYNTGSAFEHYDDGIEHSLWLNLMRDRLVILHKLLRNDGTLWVTLDDNEAHYFKVLADEIFGRCNFLGTVIWEKSDSPRMDADFFSSRHDYIIVYAKDKAVTRFNRIIDENNQLPSHYDKVDENGFPYYLKPLRAMGGQGDSREARPNLYYELEAPDGSKVFPKKQDGTDGAWRWGKKKVQDESHRIEWVQGRNGWTPYYRIYGDVNIGRPPETIWPHSEVGSNRTSKAEVKQLFDSTTPFSTPKPERLLKRIIGVATNPGDFVLDSFAGSGTTGAVAHKMGRKWIMVELGEHCHTHIIPRLQKVIDGTDIGGISTTAKIEPMVKLCKSCKEGLCENCAEVVGESQKGGTQVWFGGEGFKYYYLAPSLLKQDTYGNWIIDEDYNPNMLAAAMAKHEGFRYQPDEIIYWKQGQSTEKDFIFTTTNFVTVEFLDKIHEEMQPDESLLICCKSFRKECEERYPNITVKKIPKMLLGRCEFGRDDYSLNVINTPPEKDDGVLNNNEVVISGNGKQNGHKADNQKQLSLMGE